MAEDWNAIAAEVDAALRSVADIGQSGGYPAVLQSGGDVPPANPWDPPGGDPVYTTVYVIEGVREIRDINGTAILETLRTLTISATGAIPTKGQRVAVGITADQVTDATVWNEMIEVRPLAPAGVAVLYDVDLGA